MELVNVPLFDGSHCYMICSMTNERRKRNFKKAHGTSYQSPAFEVKNHRIRFSGSAGKFETQFRVQGTGDVINDKWLCVSFIVKRPNSADFLLGVVNLNLIDYVNETKPKDLKFLLDKSKTNSIAKLSLLIKPLVTNGRTAIDSSINYQSAAHRKGKYETTNSVADLTPGSLVRSDDRVRHSRSKSHTLGNEPVSTIPAPKEMKKSSSTIDNLEKLDLDSCKDKIKNSIQSLNSLPLPSPSHKSSESKLNGALRMTSLDQKVQEQPLNIRTIMNNACEDALAEHSLLDELVNKTFKFTWQLKSVEYEEFTPNECVKDIIEHNGNGWRKNEEGFDMVDIIHSQYNNEANRQKLKFYLDHQRESKNGMIKPDFDDQVFEDFKRLEDFDMQFEDDDSDDFNESETYNHYYRESNKQRTKTIKRFKPLTEAEFRDDLRSWSVNLDNFK